VPIAECLADHGLWVSVVNPAPIKAFAIGAKILCDNLNALAVYAAAPEPITRMGRTGRTYQINRTASIGLLKSRWQRWLLYAVPSFDEITAVLAELLKNLVAWVPGASKPSLKGPKPHRHFAYKSYA
jgi:hypothetical protein